MTHPTQQITCPDDANPNRGECGVVAAAVLSGTSVEHARKKIARFKGPRWRGGVTFVSDLMRYLHAERDAGVLDFELIDTTTHYHYGALHKASPAVFKEELETINKLRDQSVRSTGVGNTTVQTWAREHVKPGDVYLVWSTHHVQVIYHDGTGLRLIDQGGDKPMQRARWKNKIMQRAVRVTLHRLAPSVPNEPRRELPTEPKVAPTEDAGKSKAKGKNLGIGRMMRELLLNGHDAEDIVRRVRDVHPLSRATKKDVSIVRSKLRREGLLA